MKFDRNAKIEEAVSKDASRYAITEPYFDGENLVATDGHIMAVIPIDKDKEKTADDEKGYIPKAFLKKVRGKAGKYSDLELSISKDKVSGTTKEGYETVDSPLQDATFVSYKNVLIGERKETSVSFDAEKLFRLSNALGAGGFKSLVLHFKQRENGDIEPLAVVRVTVTGSKNHGVISPRRA